MNKIYHSMSRSPEFSNNRESRLIQKHFFLTNKRYIMSEGGDFSDKENGASDNSELNEIVILLTHTHQIVLICKEDGREGRQENGLFRLIILCFLSMFIGQVEGL